MRVCPGIDPTQDVENWAEQELASPLDTSMLTPVATHFILHILFTPPGKRMSADEALRHPVFWQHDYEVSDAMR